MSADELDFGPTAQAVNHVWCETCQHTHVGTIPVTTFRCAGDDQPCGFGCWGTSVAVAHADGHPDHIVHPVVHTVTEIAP